jgi:putative ABC transport system ATP-binding protein
LLTSRNRDAGTTLVLVTHDKQLAAIADRTIVIRDGMVVADELQTSPLLQEAL